MDRLVTLSRALYTLAGGVTLLALVTYVTWRPAAAGAARSHVAAAVSPAIAPVSAPAGPNGHDSVAIGQIVSANIFSPDRSPPRRRYLPPTAMPTPASSPSTDTTRSGPPPIRLYGVTLSGADGGVALIEADSKIPGAELYRVGDLVRGAILTALSESTAVLVREDGSVFVLRLVPRQRRQP
jgi:hypothetical protein